MSQAGEPGTNSADFPVNVRKWNSTRLSPAALISAPRLRISCAIPYLLSVVPNPASPLLIVLYALVAIPPLCGQGSPISAPIMSVPLGAALIALSVVDLRSFRLSDTLTLPLIAAGTLLSLTFGWDLMLWRLGSAAAGFLFFVPAQNSAERRAGDGRRLVERGIGQG